MYQSTAPWDYLVITASNDAQAAAYEGQIRLRRELGFLSGAREVLVVADPGGRRVGSGGSTIYCLMTILNRELSGAAGEASRREDWEKLLRRLRILIVHAGGDSRRLPVYGPCGKVFIPVPGESDAGLCMTLFDRQLPTYLALPPARAGEGEVVITSGDVLLGFDPAQVRFRPEGLTGLGCYADPEEASRHGVFCSGGEGEVRLFLQKPSASDQEETGAMDRYGRSILDIGVMRFDAATAGAFLALCGAAPDEAGRLVWTGGIGGRMAEHGLDFYREICCALGTEATAAHHAADARKSGATWGDDELARIHEGLAGIPFHVDVLGHCSFLHFGTLQQIVASGLDLLRGDRGGGAPPECLSVNNEIAGEGRLDGKRVWVEGCRIGSELQLGGGNVVVGLDVEGPLTVPAEACVDVLSGKGRGEEAVWFFRCYHARDDLKGSGPQGGTIWRVPVADLPSFAEAEDNEIWPLDIPREERGIWNARLFPAMCEPGAYGEWWWLLTPGEAKAEDWAAWRAAERYSLAEIAELTDQEAFHARRAAIRGAAVLESLPIMLRPESELSSHEVAYLMARDVDNAAWLARLMREACRYHVGEARAPGVEGLGFSRVIHMAGAVAERLERERPGWLGRAAQAAADALSVAEREWLDSVGLAFDKAKDAESWAAHAKELAFQHLGATIASSAAALLEPPRNALRQDEIVWGRAPARLDLGGGWSDTPPYCLERGGCVINAAVDLNGQPPIQAYARVIEEPVIRLGSIDFGKRLEITELAQLLDYRHAGSEFSLPKAALAISGFSHEAAPWPAGAGLRDMLEAFGGGIELTTLAAIPGGSGLGTSSIMGAVVLAVVQRIMGETLSQRGLFHGVLRLEQALTTGGGWQDQIGGAVGGVKIITTEPGLVPDPRIHFVPGDVLDPAANGGCTRLYYTGITRLAKNILQNVVGRYLDRDRAALEIMGRIHGFPARVSDAMARKDRQAFGQALAEAWELKKAIDPGSTNGQIEALLERIHPYSDGVKLMGAGGGGFLLIVCKSAGDAAALEADLEANPPNARARFFDFNVSPQGLVVTVC